MPGSENSTALPLLIYDGECGFCKVWIDYWRELTGDRVEYAPFQEVASQFPKIPLEEFKKSVQLILPGGQTLSGAAAVFGALATNPKKRWWLWLYDKIPGFAYVAERAYNFIAAHRGFALRITRLLWGPHPKPLTYELVRWFFLRILGVVYFIAFVSFGLQAAGLIGSAGILPLGDFLASVKEQLGLKGYWLVPTLFWLSSSDGFITLVSVLGALFALFLVFRFLERTSLIMLLVLYLSLVTAGQVFMSFQWDILLLEVGFLAIFLSFFSSHIVIWLFRWLLFRFVFLSGVVKLLSGDLTWRNLTALTFHYETQPLPTALSWYFHQLPVWFHKFSAVNMFAIELAVPFLFFAPRRLRFVAGFLIISLETLILLTGNYTFFNILTIALAIFLLDDKAIRWLAPGRVISKVVALVKSREVSMLGRRFVAVLAIVILVVSGSQLIGVFSGTVPKPGSYLVRVLAPFRIINTYGLFAVMTTTRNEIVIEGSNDGETWRAYEFKYKPGDLARRPKQVAPHQPRLDWQMWFAVLRPYQQSPWFTNFMARILQGSPKVLALLDKNPFPSSPPRLVRAVIYEYHFTDFDGLRDGRWWKRELKGLYFPVASLTAN